MISDKILIVLDAESVESSFFDDGKILYKKYKVLIENDDGTLIIAPVK